jgi:hypothetical protein
MNFWQKRDVPSKRPAIAVIFSRHDQSCKRTTLGMITMGSLCAAVALPSPPHQGAVKVIILSISCYMSSTSNVMSVVLTTGHLSLRRSAERLLASSGEVLSMVTTCRAPRSEGGRSRSQVGIGEKGGMA